MKTMWGFCQEYKITDGLHCLMSAGLLTEAMNLHLLSHYTDTCMFPYIRVDWPEAQIVALFPPHSLLFNPYLGSEMHTKLKTAASYRLQFSISFIWSRGFTTALVQCTSMAQASWRAGGSSAGCFENAGKQHLPPNRSRRTADRTVENNET